MNSKCPICKNEQLEKVSLSTDFSITSDGIFLKEGLQHLLCLKCAYIFIPLETRLDSVFFYSQKYEYLLGSENEEHIAFNSNSTYSEHLINFIKEELEQKPTGRLIDVGAGKGNLLQALYKKFPKMHYEAIEPSKAFHELKNIEFIQESKNAFFQSKLYKKSYNFDFIILNGVLEHVENPFLFLMDLKNIILEEGVISIVVPNFYNNENDFFTKDHISKFTPKSIEVLFNLCGFKILRKSIGNEVTLTYAITPSSDVKKNFEVDQNAINKIRDRFLGAKTSLFTCDSIAKNKQLIFYGQGIWGLYLIKSGLVDIENIPVLIDDNPFYQGRKWQNTVPIISFEEFKVQNIKNIPILLSMNRCYHEKVKQKLKGYEVISL